LARNARALVREETLLGTDHDTTIRDVPWSPARLAAAMEARDALLVNILADQQIPHYAVNAGAAREERHHRRGTGGERAAAADRDDVPPTRQEDT
jgi:hypothetical protein